MNERKERIGERMGKRTRGHGARAGVELKAEIARGKHGERGTKERTEDV